MRLIHKGREPATLRAYRGLPGATYDGADRAVRDDLRAALLRDQAWLCCYCMRRISSDELANPANPDAPLMPQMKVEHWRSQTRFPELALAWSNLLGGCLGGVGVAPPEQTCDTRKGDSEITLNPCDPAHVATLRCTVKGRLESSDPTLQADIDERLGLNHRVLVAERRAVLQRAFARLNASYGGREYPPTAVRTALAMAEATTGARAPACCGALRLWARGRFGRAW